MEQDKNILIVYAHPFSEKSRVNRTMIERVTDTPHIKISNLYEKYPDFHIDVKKEQELLLEADLIVLHHPIYWFSSPAIIKEWIFVVLLYGFAHGEGGDALRGKQFMLAVSAAGVEESYSQKGFNNFTLEEFLRPIEQTAKVCGMHYKDPFKIFGTPHLTKGQIDAHANEYKNFLVSFTGHKITK